MRRAIFVALVVLSLAGAAAAQKPVAVKKANYDDVYCSGVISTSSVPYDTYLISGEESNPETVYSQGHYVYINKGSSSGVNVGDEFLVIRPVKDSLKMKWFESQPWLLRAMGQRWNDIGRIKVVSVSAEVATAQVMHACDFLQRGDYVRPFAARSAPTIVMTPFNRFAPPSGKELAMVVSGKEYKSGVATHDIVFVNLGSSQGVREGDYFRVFRYQKTRSQEKPYQIRSMQDRVWGFGSVPRPARYSWDDLPREALGEGIVLRTGENASTVLLTYAVREIYVGDYVEHEGPREVPAPPPPPPAPAAPNQPPSLSCSAERGQVTAGERVRVSGAASDPEGGALRYSWRSNGGQISGSGAAVVLDTSGLNPGNYTVTGRVEDPAGAAADCSVGIRVLAAEGPAQASKTHEGFFRTQSAVVDNVFKRILDDVALRMRSEPNGRVLLVGYADGRESNADQLAAQRAANAKAYLVGKGVASNRVDTRVAAGQAGAGRQNQRVDVIWIPQGATY
jgi:outer membrane protein OmpA-like peptidoglycan-associated protein